MTFFMRKCVFFMSQKNDLYLLFKVVFLQLFTIFFVTKIDFIRIGILATI